LPDGLREGSAGFMVLPPDPFVCFPRGGVYHDRMSIILERAVILLIIAIVVALIARRLHLPYTVGLVFTGIVLALTHSGIEVTLTHDFIFDVILPPLLFEAAIHLHWSELRRDMFPVLVLATLGVVISALFVAWGMSCLAGWPWLPSLVFGVLIAATDPVAVIAMFKDINVKGRLKLCVEAESLFNDGVAAVFLTLVLSASSAANTHALDATQALWAFVVTVGGGLFVGAIGAMIAEVIAGTTTDHLLETALTTVVAYGSFLFAESLGVSGVLATVAAGLLMGNTVLSPSASNITGRGRAFALDFWEFFAFLADSLIFLLIGLHLATIPFERFGISVLIAAIALAIAGRAVAIYPLCLPFSRSRWAIPPQEQHVLWWGGLRGALGLALALSLPANFPFANDIVAATFGVVAFSVLVQGLTIPPLIKRLGLASSGKS
jgi:CPA1 family monovalent cation:H+ antiporter